MRFAILASTNGTDIPAIIEGTAAVAKCVILITDQDNCGATKKAAAFDIPVRFVDPKGKKRAEFDAEVTAILEKEEVELICLVGFMRLVSPEFVERWRHKIINVHPALLPKYPGTHSIDEALASGEKETGATVHYVDEGMDTGEIIVQKKVSIDPEDTHDTLKQKIQAVEQELYPAVIRKIAASRESD